MLASKFIRIILVAGLLVGVAGVNSQVLASINIPSQMALDPTTTVTKYEDPMPDFSDPALGGRVNGVFPYTVRFEEFQQKVLSNSFYTGLPAPFADGTMVFGYGIDQFGKHYPASGKGLYPGFTVEVIRGIRTFVDYQNHLFPAPGAPPPFDNAVGPSLQKYLTWDQSIHWANPLGLSMDDPARKNAYLGPQPAVVHLHGAEVPSAFDGGPDQWWTPGGEGKFWLPSMGIRGAGYVSNAYQYPNTQEPTTLWFHDHTLGGTRLNVYAGLAAFYFLRGNGDNGFPGHGKLPAGRQEVEIVIQDRQFDTNGQLFFPDGHPDEGLNGPPPNPDVHPFWNPEFFGNVIVVNGKSWPFLKVTPQRYRLRLLEGSNARFYNLTLRVDAPDSNTIVPFYVIGTDGGLLDFPVQVTNLLYAPGERYDIIVDFKDYAGKTIYVTNDANGPYPDGDAPNSDLEGQIMQFQVGSKAVWDISYDPASGKPLRGYGSPVARSLEKIVRLPGTEGGPPLGWPIADGHKVQAYRQLTLIENQGPGGPLEVLVNNTKWAGIREGTNTPIPDSKNVGGFGNWMTELPQVGSTEVWDIINITGDAHPIHLHLVQFQIIGRIPIDAEGYSNAYAAAFPGSMFIPGYGPPMDYNTPNAAGAIGGNPDYTSYIQPVVGSPDGLEGPPRPVENGWKDTFIMPPDHVTRVVVRWTPQELPVGNYAGKIEFPFDPTDSNPWHIGKGLYPGGPGYVWHCHIVDHEDNEMMRPYIPSKSAGNTYP